MKVLLLADIGSSHTEKWALGLASKGIQVGLFSFNSPKYNWYEGVKNIEIVFHPDVVLKGNKLKEKLGYLRFLPELKSKLKEFKPDILHAHYASSYGFIGALSKFKPFIISVWGSDVYEFPKKNFLNKQILKFSLSKAGSICSTSYCMKKETQLYTTKDIIVIPFGIDVDKFKRSEEDKVLLPGRKIVIGNIKSLEDKYGIDTLIKAFHKTKHNNPTFQFELLIVGDGNERLKFENLVKELNLQDSVVFTGRVNHNEIPEYHKKIDVFTCLSKIDSESFGVSLVEAMASGSVVVASDVQGFSEVLDYGNEYGYLVEKNNPEAVAKIISGILSNPEKALDKTKKARQRVLDLYDWNENLDSMVKVYNEQIS